MKLKTARLILNHALAIEEKYELLISSFLELEHDVFDASVSEMVRRRFEYKDFFPSAYR
jgi:hypothetical protein